MFNLEIKSSCLSQPSQRGSFIQHLEKLLNEMIELPFEDATDFSVWAEESLPLIHWQKHPSPQGEISICLLFWSSQEPYSEYFFNALKKKLVSEDEIPMLSLQHFDFALKEIPQKKLSLTEVKLVIETPLEVDRILALMPSLAEEILFEIRSPLYGRYLAHQSKPILVQERIAKIKRRFYSRIDEQIFEEAKGFLALAENKFIEQRSYQLLSRLILSQYFMRKAFIKALSASPNSRHVFCRVLPSHLSSPFASKTVFGIFVGINFLHKYDTFTEEHLLRALQKLDINVQLVAGSVYSFQRHSESFKFIYLEVEKKEEKLLTLDERKRLCHELKEVLRRSVERLQPSVFMVNNEEEIIKNVLFLSREIHTSSDLPQVMIHFEEQTDKDICFRILLVHGSQHDLSLQHSFRPNEATYVPHWTQVVRHFKKKRPIQAHVFRLRLLKTLEMLRSDASLDFYAARQRISQLLHRAIGEFRDFNGGIILKQGEILAQFKRFFHELPPEILENFFYGLAPLEIQASISLSDLITFFQLFLEGKNHNFSHPQDCLIKFLRQETQTYAMLQAKEPSFSACLKSSLNPLKIDPKDLIILQLKEEDRLSLGYIFESTTEAKHLQLIKALENGVESWKKKLQNIKTLRLAMPSGLRSLDPRIQIDEETKTLLKLLFEGLMRIDSCGKADFGIAEKVKISPDRKKYTFKLRPAVWSNGAPITADDFVYAWRTVVSPHFKGSSAYLFYPLKNARQIKEGRLPLEALGVRALDRARLEVELDYQAPYFLELLAQPQFSPIYSALDQSQPTWPYQEGDRYVCNGAFVLKKNHLSNGYELIKNPSYHDAANIHLDKIFIKNAQPNEIKELFLRDEIDWLGFPLGAIDLFSLPFGQGETLVLPNDSIYWYVFNTSYFPLNTSKIRRALALAIDRARILQVVHPGHWPAFNMLPFQHSRGALMEESRQKGIELFEEALKELGLNKRSFPILKLQHAEGKTRNNIAKMTKEIWEETFGIRCKIEAQSWDEIFSRLTEGDFQICGINWINSLDDPSYTLENFHNLGRFAMSSRWSHQEYKALLDRAYREKSRSKRLYYYALAEEILFKEVPVIPLVRTLPCSMKKERIEMFSHSSLKSWDFKWATIRNPQK